MVEFTIPLALDLIRTIGIVVGIIYYITVMRNSQRNQELARKAQEQALETRQAQLFMNIYGQMAAKEAQTNILDLDTIEVNSYEDWDKLKEDREKFKVFAWYLTFYEGIGVFLEEGLIDVRLIAKMLSGNITMFWQKYRDGIYDMRIQQHWPRFVIMVEYLYNQIVDYAEKHPELEIETPEKL